MIKQAAFCSTFYIIQEPLTCNTVDTERNHSSFMEMNPLNQITFTNFYQITWWWSFRVCDYV